MKTSALALLLASVTLHAAAPVPPVPEGLQLWLDASAQKSLRQAASMPPVSSQQPVDFLLDASPARRHFTQPVAERRPVFVSDGESAFLKCDGADDFLAMSGTRQLAPALTVFVLAAPRANAGMFTGIFAASEAGKNDYTNGITLDFGPVMTKDLSVVNAESAGATGFRDLIAPGFFNAAERPFGDFHVFTVRSRIAKDGTEFFLDGFKGGARDRMESMIGLDQMVLGGRYYSNDPAQPPCAQGTFAGAIAEVLVYDRALSDAERQKVEQSLLDKMVELHALLRGAKGHALETLSDAPPVQMLVPGFSVSELPVKLTNRNNVRYRHDGKLVALGYDGTIHLLSDTDGDGLEDKADVFWDKPTMRGPLGIELTKKDDPRGDGVFVPSKGKVSLILDKDRDGRADEEIIVATGWGEIMQNVDAVGIAIDPKDGSIYFGLGCTNFANAYLIDPKTGKAGYDLKSEHGTIQKVSADFSKRETVCTGVRFTCALGFNREGDLFATEQEGATWLPNGNPLDELLHIVPGKHYGFPPRHPKHLPDVIDWPAVMEYGPQHQSTVGMCFNEGVNGGPHFGPDFWASDALVCGESRGKLYRTKLVKTPDGYVGQNHLIACLGLLTVDCCVSPKGDLLIACHSGPPDWGTGPKGDGRIFKVKYAGKNLPQPVWAWASAPDEFRVAFDRELKPEEWAGLVGGSRGGSNGNSGDGTRLEPKRSGDSRRQPGRGGQDARAPGAPRNSDSSRASGNPRAPRIRIEAGRHVSAGDRYEVIRPGYQIVRDQMAEPRRDVDVLGLTLTSDRRTIILKVPRQTEPVGYAVTLPLPETWRQKSAIPQRSEMDVLVTLNGVEVKGNGLAPAPNVPAIVMPHVDTAISRKLVRPLETHSAFYRVSDEALKQRTKPGEEPLSGFDAAGVINAADPFVPDVQPGAALDWTPDAKPARLSDTGIANIPLVNKGFFDPEPVPAAPGYMRFRTAFDTPFVRAFLLCSSDHQSTVPLSRLFVPWANSHGKTAEPAAQPTKAPGNWLAGRRVFFSNEAACFTCHQIRGEGVAVGPDLTNLVFRDRESVLRDILHPSATINPDHPASMVKLKNGNNLTGIVRRSDDKEVTVALQAGATPVLSRADVTGIELLKTSFMPEDYAERLTKEQQDDLLNFLTTSALEPAPIERTDPPAPAPRKQAEVTALIEKLKNTDPSHRKDGAEKPKPLRILLASGPKDHGAGEHDYPLWQKRWAKLLPMAEGVTVDTAWEFPKPEQLAAADVTVFYSKNPGFNLRTVILLDEYQQRGGGLVYLHWALNGDEHAQVLAERIGLAGGKFGVKFRHGEFDLVFSKPEHPVTRGLPTLHFTDETYWALQGDPSRIRILGTGVEEGAPHPQLWAMERGKGRVIGCVPGHYTWTFDDPYFRLLVLRSICWTGKQENIDRLIELCLPGARIAP